MKAENSLAIQMYKNLTKYKIKYFIFPHFIMHFMLLSYPIFQAGFTAFLHTHKNATYTLFLPVSQATNG
jgi:hypothetical protein